MRQNDLQLEDKLQEIQDEKSLLQKMYQKEMQRQQIYKMLLQLCRNGGK